MGGVYGDMLAAFPELMKAYTVFKMKPHTGAGYGERYNQRTVTGYWSWRKGGKAGIESEARVSNHQATFWAQDNFLTGKSMIGQFDYIEKDGNLYLVIEDDEFSHEGSFTKCLMQRVAGVTDQQHTNTNVDTVIRGDYE
jgi:hypothetical protein